MYIFWPSWPQKAEAKGKNMMDSRTWNLRGKYLKTCHLRFFSSENKKSPKNLLVSDDVLKICYFFVFGPQNCQKLFFSEIITKKLKIGPNQKNTDSTLKISISFSHFAPFLLLHSAGAVSPFLHIPGVQ